jgi:putative DNA primase/helicase
VVDADTPELQKVMKDFTPTFTVKTAKGFHYYYKVPDMDKKIVLQNDKGHFGEIQSVRTFVVGPNSIHPSGAVYEVINNIPIAEISVSEIKTRLNDFLPDMVDSKEAEEELKIIQENKLDIPITSIISLSGLTKRGDEYQGAHPVHGSETGMNFCVNPSKNTWHCFRCNSGGGALSLLAVKEGIIRCDEAKPGALKGEKFKQLLKIAKEKYGLKDEMKKEEKVASNEISPDSFFVLDDERVGKFVPERLAKFMMDSHKFLTMRDSQDIYYFDDGIWNENGESLIKQIATRLLQERTRQMHIRETIGYIQATTFFQRDIFDSPPLYLIPLQNGVLDLRTMQLGDYFPEYYFSYKIPVAYDSNAVCPTIEKFFDEIVQPEDRKLLIEIPAYCLHRGYPIQKAVMFVGGGANAKSTYLNLVTSFLGFKNVSSISLQSIEHNRFASVDLYRKLANIFADLPNISLKNPGQFKMLVGGDLMRAEKKFKDSFKFYNHAKLLYSANVIPYVEDESDAFFRRWIIINFPFKFEGAKADTKILEKLTTPQELSGLLNLAIPALKKVLDIGFSYSKTTDQVKRLYKEFSSSISSFGFYCIVQSDEDYVAKDELYEAYRQYCRARNLPVDSNDKFFKQIRKDFAVSDYRPEGPKGERPQCLRGIKLIEAPEPQAKLSNGDNGAKL